MSAFEDFIKIELPLRQVLITDSFNPALSGTPALRGTYFLDTSDNYRRYEKTGGGNTDWTPIGGSTEDEVASLRSDVDALSGQFSGSVVKKQTALSTDSSNLSSTAIACFNTTQVKTVKYVVHVENSNSFCAFELLVTYHNTNTQGEGIKHVAYAAVGQTDLTSIETTQNGTIVSVNLIPTEPGLVVYCTGVVVASGTNHDLDCI